jgi:peptidoglycan-associated lipoprotein
MKRIELAALLVLGGGCAVLGVGCAHKAETRNTATTAAGPASSTDASNAATASSTAGDNTGGGAGLAACGLVRVHFPFNSADLEDADKATLQRSADCLRADRGLHITIEGNADERGTEEYNLALGDRRAASVQRYLEALGVSQRQLATVSYGKERPLCTEHDEACWSQNRQAALRPSGHAGNTATP